MKWEISCWNLGRSVDVSDVIAKEHNLPNMAIKSCLGNLQRQEEVQQTGVRGCIIRLSEHGYYCRIVHPERYPRWGGECECAAYCTSVLQQNLHVSVSISRHIAEKGWPYHLLIAFIKYVFKMQLFIYVYLLAQQQVFV